MNSQVRFGWQAMLAVLVAGLLIGWFGIGWAMWPVQWENTDPIDLRQDQREEYLVLVASDYSATEDSSTALRRLSSWSSLEDLDREYPAALRFLRRARAGNHCNAPEEPG